MAQRSKTSKTSKSLAPIVRGKAAIAARHGVRTADQFANVMSFLIDDLLNGNVNTNVANAVSTAGRNMLQLVAMQYKHGQSNNGRKPIMNLNG